MAACTDVIRARILDATRIGAYQKEAAAYAGVGENTLCTWLRRGRADEAAGRESVYADFVGEFEQAEAAAVIRALGVVQRAAVIDNDWRAAMALLARRHPDRWGEHGRVDVQVTPVEPADIELTALIRQAQAKQDADEVRLRGESGGGREE